MTGNRRASMIWLGSSPEFGLSGSVGTAKKRKFRTTTVARLKPWRPDLPGRKLSENT
jgi:hypothetical protein